jgi:hypothetical protein
MPRGAAEFRESDRLWMALDPASREALRLGDGPAAGPAFFTSPEAMRDFAARAGLTGHEPYEVPAAVLTRMKGKPFYLDGEPGSVAEAARRLRARESR